MGDTATPGHNPVLEPGDVIRVDKGTIITLSSPSSGKGMLGFILQKLGVQVANIFTVTGQHFMSANMNSGAT